MFKKIALIAVVALAVVVGLWTANGMSQGAMTPEMAERELFAASESPAQNNLYEVIREGYPDEYAAFLVEMADFANRSDINTPQAQQDGFQIGQQFTIDLRRDNARYLATAPLSSFVEMRDANLKLLTSMMIDTEMCGRMVLYGGGGLTMNDMPRVDMEIMAATGVTLFKAMIAGRDTPMEHDRATEAEIREVVDMWQLLPDTTPAQVTAFFARSPSNPNTCSANISFERFLNTSDDPKVQRVAVHLSQLAAGI